MVDLAFIPFIEAAAALCVATDSDAVLVFMERTVDWERIKKKADQCTILAATHLKEVHQSAVAAGIRSVLLDAPESSVQDRLSQAVLECVADEMLRPGSTVVTVYCGFDPEDIDTISVLKLGERLGRLTARDLRRLETKVPLETLKTVVDLAVAIGREGREGKAVGTMFVVGDHRKVLRQSRPGGFDFVKAYSRRERSLFDPRVREGIKEYAQVDGMFVISSQGTVEASARIIDTSPVEITMTTGLGSRHFAGAAISKNTKAIAVVVSQTSGTVRIYQNGEIVLRIEPLQRAMKWKEFGTDGGAAGEAGSREK